MVVIWMKIFLTGKDNVRWVMDAQLVYTKTFLTDIGHTPTSNFLRADAVHSVWWNSLLSLRAYPLRQKNCMAFATNWIDTDSSEFLKAKKFVNLWIAPSKTMHNKLELAGVDVKYQPFYADEKTFYKVNESREQIARELGINYELLRDKLVIGSFQRDSLGADLSKPKWQKGPEILIDILKELPMDRFILFLAGPRRHWVIDLCKKLGISYFYYGKEPKKLKDDLHRNTLDRQTINKLYTLTDLYVVSSRSEGGPMAVLESAFAETMILSTDVGLASDVLHPWCIYRGTEDAVEKIREIIERKDISEYIKFNYEQVDNLASYKPMRDRWREIYEYFENAYIT